MGSDYTSAAWGGAIPLTSVEMLDQDIGSIGLDLLLAEITESPETHTHRTVVLEPRLSIRESTIGRHHPP